MLGVVSHGRNNCYRGGRQTLELTNGLALGEGPQIARRSFHLIRLHSPPDRLPALFGRGYHGTGQRRLMRSWRLRHGLGAVVRSSPSGTWRHWMDG